MSDHRRDLFAPVDRAPPVAATAATSSFRWVPGAIPAVVLISALALAVMLPRDIAMPARLALLAFGAAGVLWTMTRLNAAYVALGAVLFLALVGAIEQEELFEALEADVIWLMIGAFMLGAAVQASGLAGRMVAAVAGRSARLGTILWRVTLVLIPLAFLIPSTSGRAAIALPLFRARSVAAGDRRATRALALLIPCIILVSTIVSLVGAGSHLIANDLLAEVSDSRIGFGAWALYGLPFGVVASLATGFVISRMFLDRALRHRLIEGRRAAREPLSRAEITTLAVAAAMVALWIGESAHGIEIATVSIAGAFVLTMPGIGVISWKQGLGAVSWNLIFFVGAALVLGETLIDTGAARWLIDRAFEASGVDDGGRSELVMLAGLVALGLTSHIYLTSHAARTAALLPPMLYLGAGFDMNLAAVAFIATAGMDYCLTFPVSSKALLVYQEAANDALRPADLLRLSAVMLPVHAVLMIAFYYIYWRPIGLEL